MAGITPERYVHIHPAKYSRHTIRVKANTLKTVLALKYASIKLMDKPNYNLQEVNRIRVELLGFSPIKSIRKGDSEILRLWELFQCKRI